MLVSASKPGTWLGSNFHQQVDIAVGAYRPLELRAKERQAANMVSLAKARQGLWFIERQSQVSCYYVLPRVARADGNGTLAVLVLRTRTGFPQAASPSSWATWSIPREGRRRGSSQPHVPVRCHDLTPRFSMPPCHAFDRRASADEALRLDERLSFIEVLELPLDEGCEPRS